MFNSDQRSVGGFTEKSDDDEDTTDGNHGDTEHFHIGEILRVCIDNFGVQQWSKLLHLGIFDHVHAESQQDKTQDHEGQIEQNDEESNELHAH